MRVFGRTLSLARAVVLGPNPRRARERSLARLARKNATPTLRPRSPVKMMNPTTVGRRWVPTALLLLLVQAAGCADRSSASGSAAPSTKATTTAGTSTSAATTKADAPSAATSAPAAVGPLDPRLVGHWTFKGADEPRFTFAKKGRVKMTLGTQRCLGKWSTTPNEELLVEYDPNQSGCSWGPAISYSLSDNDASLRFLGASYTRVDANDESSLP